MTEFNFYDLFLVLGIMAVAGYITVTVGQFACNVFLAITYIVCKALEVRGGKEEIPSGEETEGKEPDKAGPAIPGEEAEGSDPNRRSPFNRS